MSDRSLLTTGMTIQIRRTDGRTHGAIVSSVNPDMKTVTVEWLEKGETKGKEIDIDTIFALNGHLNPQNNLHHGSAGDPPKIPKGSSGNWEDEKNVNNGETEINNHDEVEDNSHDVFSTDCDNGNVKVRSTDIRSLPHLRSMLSSRASLPSVSKAGRLTKVQPHTANGFFDTKQGSSTERSRGVENIPPPSAPLMLSKTSSSCFLSGQDASQSSSRAQRRSNVVKEVEKLKKNREERRLRQAEKKEEKEALMNVDPGNPNWQFLAMIREYQAALDFRPLRDTDPVECHQITVCVRKRPLNKKELSKKEVDVISVPRKDLVVVHEPKSKVDLTKYLENQQFRFDYAFDETCSNETVYKYTAKPLVQTIFDGGMATCFAYGQTGSGKTHTMGGTFSGKQQDCKKGIYAMVAKDIFTNLKSPQYRSYGLVVAASFFEIYSGKVFDLLADKAKLRVLEDGKQQVQIWGLTETVVNTVEEVLNLIQAGNQARTSGQTSANSNSSRSHAVFQITLRMPGSHKVHGKFSLIDLAGNERGADTSSANRLTRMEGAEINKSLLALKECIRALGRKGGHLPFRASKLTQVLKDSFIGDNTKTCMIAMISPGMSSCEHSLNTLRYADRVKELAATDPSTEDIDDDSKPTGPDAENHEESDLAALRSLNEEEISADLYNFHEAVSHLQKLEEEMLDQLKTTRENTSHFLEIQDRLVTQTHNVDYDQEGSHLSLASDLHAGLEEHLSTVMALRDRVMAFRQQLIEEEEISKKMTPIPHSRHFN